MKKLVWALAVLLAIVGGALVFVAYSASALVARYKPLIERAASDAVGASVTFGEISASVFPSVQLDVHEARVTAQPGDDEALVLKGLVLHVKLWPLLARRLVIETVSLDEPTVTVVKTKTGVFLQGLPRRRVAPEPGAVPPPAAAPLPVEASAAALNVDLRSFEINDATVTLRDTENQSEMALTDINLVAALRMAGGAATVSNLSVQAALPGGERVAASGTGQSFDLRSGQLTLGNLEVTIPGGVVALAGAANVNTGVGAVTVSSAGITLDDVISSAVALDPAVKGITLRGTLKPDLKASFGEGAYTTSGNLILQDVAFKRDTLSLSGLSGSLLLAGDDAKHTVTTGGLPFVLRNQPATVSFAAVVAGDSVHVEPLKLAALSGTLTGSIEASLTSPNRFVANLQGAGFSVADALAFVNPRAPVQIEGVVSALTLHARGHAGGDVVRSLDGTAGVGLKHATFKGFNLGAEVLQGVNRIPLLAGAVDAPKFRKLLSSKDTTIESLTGDFTIKAGWAETHNLHVVSGLFTLTGSGRISFQTDVDLLTTITFNPELSAVMIGRAKELRPVLNEDGTLSIPVAVKGRPPKFDAQPDLTRLLAGSTKNVLEGTVGRALEKALTGEKKEGGKLLDRLLGK